MNKAINLTNKYIVLATPLILYSLISSVYLTATAMGGKLLSLLFAIILFILMTATFIAGWFNMIKIAIQNPTSDEPNSLIKEFPAGVGEYILSSLGALVVIFFVFAFIFIVSFKIGINTIGDPQVSTEALANALKNTTALNSFVQTLSVEQLTKISLWNTLILIAMTFGYFLNFLYIPTIFFNNKNPFIAYFISLKNLFSKKFIKTLGIFLLIFVINFIISIFSTLFNSNVIIHFLITLLNFYFITAVGVGIFYYYYNQFVNQQIGCNIDVKI